MQNISKQKQRHCQKSDSRVSYLVSPSFLISKLSINKTLCLFLCHSQSLKCSPVIFVSWYLFIPLCSPLMLNWEASVNPRYAEIMVCNISGQVPFALLDRLFWEKLPTLSRRHSSHLTVKYPWHERN